jgi:hypothetical protein
VRTIAVFAAFGNKEQPMPKDNFAFKPGFDLSPDWISPDDMHLFPGMGQGPRDFIPDEDAPPEPHITPEQEMYGLDWKPGDPMVRPKTKPFMDNSGVRRVFPDDEEEVNAPVVELHESRGQGSVSRRSRAAE